MIEKEPDYRIQSNFMLRETPNMIIIIIVDSST